LEDVPAFEQSQKHRYQQRWPERSAAPMDHTITQFTNLARHQGDHNDPRVYAPVDEQVKREIDAAGLDYHDFFKFNRGRQSEVPTMYLGHSCGWGFKRAWRYWVAEGPGIPPDKADEFHARWGRVVRVLGDGPGRSPRELCHGFAVGSYHIDTQEGLNAFVVLLKSIYVDGDSEHTMTEDRR
jgi:hypothetical protein